MVEIAERTAKEANCTATVTVKKDYDPYELPQDALAIRYLHRAAGALGFPVILEEEGGGSDANFFNAYGIPTTVLGVGMTDCHTKEESLLEEDLYNAAELALEIVRQAALKS